MKYILSHLTTCTSDYFCGSHLPIVQVAVSGDSTYTDIKNSLLEYSTYEQYYDSDYKIHSFDKEAYFKAVDELFEGTILPYFMDKVPDHLYGLSTSKYDEEDYIDCYEYFTIEIDLSEELEAINTLRKQGYAIAYYEPKELKGIDKDLLEDRMIEEGSIQITEYNYGRN